MENYSEQDMILFGEYLMKLTNSVIRKRTKLKPLTQEEGESLVKDLFKNFQKDILK